MQQTVLLTDIELLFLGAVFGMCLSFLIAEGLRVWHSRKVKV